VEGYYFQTYSGFCKIRRITRLGIISEVKNNVEKYNVGEKIYFINSGKTECLAG
tara:strand:- start:2948 stop:3109 length:162 start_codon:yes stop_codon:yes gene_type:complete